MFSSILVIAIISIFASKVSFLPTLLVNSMCRLMYERYLTVPVVSCILSSV